MVELPPGMLQRFLNTLHWLAGCFLAAATLEELGSASRVAKTHVGGCSLNAASPREDTDRRFFAHLQQPSA